MILWARKTEAANQWRSSGERSSHSLMTRATVCLQFSPFHGSTGHVCRQNIEISYREDQTFDKRSWINAVKNGCKAESGLTRAVPLERDTSGKLEADQA